MITIIILLILAGVGISALTQTGLFAKANQAQQKSKYANALEKIKLATMASYDEKGNLNNEYLKENLNKIDGISQELKDITFDIEITVDGYVFKINKNGEISGTEEKEETDENLDIKITDINQDGYTVNIINNYPESMDVKYEYYIDSTKKTEKIKDKKYVINDPFSEHRISVVAYSGDKVLKSKDIIYEAPYKANPYVDSNTEGIINNGFLEDYKDQWGHATLYHAFDNNDTTMASTAKGGDNAIGCYIGYDFGKEVKVSRVAGKIRMREYVIQYSDDKESWNDAIAGTSYSSNQGDNFDNNINFNIGKHRYWRLYVKNGCSNSAWSAVVYSLQFYIEENNTNNIYIGQMPYLNSNTEGIINNGFLEDYKDQWGHATLYHAFDNNDTTMASTAKGGDNAIGCYIGYDFGKEVKVSRVAGKIRMREYVIQYSDDKESWNDAIAGTSYSSNQGDNFDDNINFNIGQHRYWRLYVKNGCSSSDRSAMVYNLQFYYTK